MRICIIQSESRGNIRLNIKNHLNLIHQAIRLKSDLIVFPELSLSGYEPKQAQKTAIYPNDAILRPFQMISDEYNVSIAIGVPTKCEEGICISMIIFQPLKDRKTYSKQILHSDELPYFVSGNTTSFIYTNNIKIAFGICFESLQRNHIEYAHQQGAEIYIASVAKSQKNIDNAFSYFPIVSKEFNLPILMSNCIGYNDGFLANGQSAVWDKSGSLTGKLNTTDQGLLVFNTESSTTEIFHQRIELSTITDLSKVIPIYIRCKQNLDAKNIHQWTASYPSKSIIEKDITNRDLYILRFGNGLLGAVALNENQPEQYEGISWEANSTRVLVVHRLVVDPVYQGHGYGHLIMAFVEDYAVKNDYSVIRLDTYSRNVGALRMYQNRDYKIRGTTYFEGRKHFFYCLEKEV